jgi:hypothetical protein
LWLEYWSVCTRSGRPGPIARLHERLVDVVANLLIAAGRSRRDAVDQARAVNAYLFGIALHDTAGVTPLPKVQRDVAALCGLPLP